MTDRTTMDSRILAAFKEGQYTFKTYMRGDVEMVNVFFCKIADGRCTVCLGKPGCADEDFCFSMLMDAAAFARYRK